MTKGVRPTSRPATGRTFVALIVVATLAAVAVMVWTFYFASAARRGRGAPATYRM
jgi:hypothetical protein